MSLYNALFGTNQLAPILLKILEKDTSDFGRFRDAYLNESGDKIIVYTRCGGGNRDDYEYVFEEMEDHPNYLSNYDDDFDSTYAYFEFSVPDKLKEEMKLLAETLGQKTNPTEKLMQLIQDIESGKQTKEVDNAIDVAKKVFNEIENTKDGENKIIEI